MNDMGYTLFMSVRSPFARRVRIVLEELGLAYATEVCDVFNPSPALRAANPLARVPVLETPDGTRIIESWMILDHLRSLHGNHPLFLHGGANPAETRSLSGLAVGIMEHIVAAFLESQRGPGITWPEAYDEAYGNVVSGFRALEERAAALSVPSGFLTGSELRLCDIDVGTAVRYARLRLPRALDGCPALAALSDRLEARDSFRKTVPPA
jgi:glutathione S-transferase